MAQQQYQSAAEAACSFFTRAFAGDDLEARAHTLLRAQPGALAGVAAVLARSCSTVDPEAVDTWELLECLDGYEDWEEGHPPLASDVWLLDAHFAACALLQARDTTTDCPQRERHCLMDSCVHRFCSPDSVRAMAQPPPHLALPAAASLAMLAGDEGAIRSLLAEGTRLETLLGGLLAAAAPEYEPTPHACSARWQLRMLRAALKAAATAAALVPPPPSSDDDQPAEQPAKRQRVAATAAGSDSAAAGGVTLTAEDVNVPRRDSTVLLIAGRPFHACGLLLERASAVLADALRDAPPSLAPIPIPLPSGVPESLHYALFTAAVEHAYTGDIGTLEASSLLPLWCVADHLAMDGVRAWCLPRMLPAMVADVVLLEEAWAAAAARPCDALCDACAMAWLRADAAAGAGAVWLARLLARLQAAAPPDATPAAQVVRVLRAALLRADATPAAEP